MGKRKTKKSSPTKLVINRDPNPSSFEGESGDELTLSSGDPSKGTNPVDLEPHSNDAGEDEHRAMEGVEKQQIEESVETKSGQGETETKTAKPWVQLFKQNRVRTGENLLRFVPPVVSDGRKIAKIHSHKVKREAEKWKSMLVGCVIGATPTFKRIEGFAMSRWKMYGLQMVQLLKPSVFLFKFDTEEGRNAVLNGGPITFDSRPLILRPWKQKLQFDEAEISQIPVWIKLPLLPLEFWGDETLSRIVSVLGKPLFSDMCTKDRLRLAFARVLVEMDAFGEFPHEIHIEDEQGEVLTQKVEYEWVPSACAECKSFTHSKHNCPRKRKVKQTWIQKAPALPPESFQEVQSSMERGNQPQLAEPGKQKEDNEFTLVTQKRKLAMQHSKQNGKITPYNTRSNSMHGSGIITDPIDYSVDEQLDGVVEVD